MTVLNNLIVLMLDLVHTVLILEVDNHKTTGRAKLKLRNNKFT